MINVQKNKDIYEIVIHANMSDVKLEDNLINITVDTKKHMYYIALPNEKRKNEKMLVPPGRTARRRSPPSLPLG